MYGVILYGPPASGKDTVTNRLVSIDPRYRQFSRAKCGGGRTASYRMITVNELESLRVSGDIIWENKRYGATYIVDKAPLLAITQAGEVPIVHLGQVPAVDAVKAAIADLKWLVVSLWCPREVAASRIKQRRTGDTEERFTAWEETEELKEFDLFIDTSSSSPEQAASLIHQSVVDGRGGRCR